MNEDELARLLHGDDRVGDADDAAARRTARTLRELLTREAVWAEPRPGGIDALLAAIAGEAEKGRRPLAAVDEEPQAEPPGPGEPVRQGEPARQGELYELRTPRSADSPPSQGRRRRTVALVSAAAALVVVATAVGLLLATDGGGGGEVAGPEYTLNGTGLDPDAVAIAQLDDPGAGLVIRLQVRGLDPAEPGTYYQGWLEGPSGKVSVGTFHMHEGGDVRLWSGVYPDDGYPTLVITKEIEGPQPTSTSSAVVLTGRLGP